MKKLLFSILFVFFFSSASAYDLSIDDQELVSNFLDRLESEYEANPSKIDTVNNNLSRIMPQFESNPRIYAVLSLILEFNQNYTERTDIQDEEEDEIIEDDTKDENDEDIADDENDEINDFDEIDYSKYDYKILSFDLEPRFDDWLLTDVYTFNVWDDLDLNHLVDEAVLLHDDKKLSYAYVEEEDWEYYLHFDLWSEHFFMTRNNYYTFDLYLKINKPRSADHIGKLEFSLWTTPLDARDWTSDGIRVLSSGSGMPMNTNLDFRTNTQHLVLKSWVLIDNIDDLSYTNAYKFDLHVWDERLQLYEFKFDITGWFVNNLPDSAEFVLYYNNNIFDRISASELSDGYLVFEHTWDADDFISARSSWNFRLEIQWQSGVSWSRDIRLQNIVIWDGFWWKIENLNDYSNTWLPADWQTHRY